MPFYNESTVTKTLLNVMNWVFFLKTMKNEVLSSYIFALCLRQHGRRYFSQHFVFSSTKLFLDRKMGKTIDFITFKDVENLHTQQNPFIFNTLYFSITCAFSLENKLT